MPGQEPARVIPTRVRDPSPPNNIASASHKELLDARILYNQSVQNLEDARHHGYSNQLSIEQTNQLRNLQETFKGELSQIRG